MLKKAKYAYTSIRLSNVDRFKPVGKQGSFVPHFIIHSFFSTTNLCWVPATSWSQASQQESSHGGPQTLSTNK